MGSISTHVTSILMFVGEAAQRHGHQHRWWGQTNLHSTTEQPGANGPLLSDPLSLLLCDGEVRVYSLSCPVIQGQEAWEVLSNVGPGVVTITLVAVVSSKQGLPIFHRVHVRTGM